MNVNTNTLRISVHFNPTSKQWIARKANFIPHKTGEGFLRENIYGYGENLMDAVDNVINTAGHLATRLICKVVTPGKHIHTLRLG